MVRRDLLMEALAGMGLHNRMLTAIVSMYWAPSLQLKHGTECDPPFVCTRGVRQGDPLSPLLFGVFFDRVERWFEQQEHPPGGVQLAGQVVRMLLYADDLVLLAEDKIRLQGMLRVLADFCEHYDMEVNAAKTCVVVFGRRRYAGSRQWFVRGPDGVRQQVPVAAEFKYLGVVLHETRGVLAGCDALAVAGRRAMWAMLSRLADSGIDSLGMKTQLFGSLVAPILSYCSEVWGPGLLRKRSGLSVSGVLGNAQHALQCEFLRLIGGKLRKSVCRVLLLREFGCKPLAHQWLVSAVCLWNRVASRRARSPADWMVLAMQDSMQMASDEGVPAHVRSSLWFVQFSEVIRGLGVLPDDHAFWSVQQQQDWPTIDLGRVSRAFDGFFFGSLQRAGAAPRQSAQRGGLSLYI